MTETPWYIVKCLSQRERWLANELRVALGLKTYVPIEIVRMPRRGVVFERRRPLVPSYVFVTSKDGIPWRDIAETRHVLGWLEGDGRPAEVRDAEIARIQEMVSRHNEALTQWQRFSPGDRVREPGGPFDSIEYLLSSVRGENVKLEAMMDGRKITRRTTVDKIERVA